MAFASRSTVETRGSRLPASIRLTSVAWTPLRSATCSWLSSNLRRASRRFGPSFPTEGIVKAGLPGRHRASHKLQKRGHCAQFGLQRRVGPIPVLWRAEISPAQLGVLDDANSRSCLCHLRDLHQRSPPLISARRKPPGGGAMLRKTQVSAKYRALGNILLGRDPMLGQY